MRRYKGMEFTAEELEAIVYASVGEPYREDHEGVVLTPKSGHLLVNQVAVNLLNEDVPSWDFEKQLSGYIKGFSSKDYKAVARDYFVRYEDSRFVVGVSRVPDGEDPVDFGVKLYLESFVPYLRKVYEFENQVKGIKLLKELCLSA